MRKGGGECSGLKAGVCVLCEAVGAGFETFRENIQRNAVLAIPLQIIIWLANLEYYFIDLYLRGLSFTKKWQNQAMESYLISLLILPKLLVGTEPRTPACKSDNIISRLSL